MKNLVTQMTQNIIFFAEFLGVVALIFLAAVLIEKWEKKRTNNKERILSTRKLTMIGMFSAIAAILMLFELPMPFAPGFYKLDFSELPVLITAYAFGPVAGVLTEFCKILLKLLLKSTSTAFVGELANFVVGCSFVLPASVVYLYKKNRKTAIVSCIVGTLSLTICGTIFNGVYLLPKFAQIYGMPLESIIAMGTAVNPAITDITGMVILAVAPLNVIKGVSVSIVTMLIYKKLSRFMKAV